MDELEEATVEDLLDAEEPEVVAVDATVWHPHAITYFGPSSRTIAIVGEINDDSSIAACSQILALEKEDGEVPIIVYINTPGGDITQALAIYDALRMVSNPIITMTTGQCASAGLVLINAGDIRVSTQHTLFFYHQPITSAVGIDSGADMTSTAKHYEWGRKTMVDIIRKRIGMKKKAWKKHFGDSTSKYFTAQEALKYGFIDSYTMPTEKDISNLEKQMFGEE